MRLVSEHINLATKGSRKLGEAATKISLLLKVWRLTAVTYRQNPENESRVSKIVFQAEVNLSDVFSWLRIIDVHINQRYGSILKERHLE